MKCIIDGVEVEAKVVDNLGWSHVHGCYAKFVLFRKKEYVVCKKGGAWRTLDFSEKLAPASDIKGQ